MPHRLLFAVSLGLIALAALIPHTSHSAPTAPELSITLNDSPTASDLASRLPLDVTLHDQMGTATVARLPFELSTSVRANHVEYQAGDVGYWNGSLVVFLTDGAGTPSDGITIVGHIGEELWTLTNCQNGCGVTLAAGGSR